MTKMGSTTKFVVNICQVWGVAVADREGACSIINPPLLPSPSWVRQPELLSQTSVISSQHFISWPLWASAPEHFLNDPLLCLLAGSKNQRCSIRFYCITATQQWHTWLADKAWRHQTIVGLVKRGPVIYLSALSDSVYLLMCLRKSEIVG